LQEVPKDYFSWKRAIINSFPYAMFWHRVGRRIDGANAEVPYELYDLMVYLSTKIKLLDASIARNSTFLGRLYNKVMLEEVESAVLDGIAIKQLFDIIGEEPPMPIKLTSTYRVGLEDLKRWYGLAANVMPAPRSNATPDSG